MQFNNFCQADTYVVANDPVKYQAPICGTPASPPGHSEQRQPPQPKDAARLGAEQRGAGGAPQMAAVHAVQNGAGGDPVLRSSLSILSSMSGLLGSQCQHSGLAIMGFKTKQFDPSRLGNILVLYILFLV